MATLGKILSHLGFSSKSFHVPLSDFRARLGCCTINPQQDVKHELWYMDFVGDPINIPWKIGNGRESSFSMELMSKVLLGPFTDLRALVGFCSSRPQDGVKYQLWYLDFVWWDPINIPLKIGNRREMLFSQLGLMSKVLLWPLSDLFACLGNCTSSPHQGFKYQIWYFYFCMRDPIIIPWTIGNGPHISLGCQISTLISGIFVGTL